MRGWAKSHFCSARSPTHLSGHDKGDRLVIHPVSRMRGKATGGGKAMGSEALLVDSSLASLVQDAQLFSSSK